MSLEVIASQDALAKLKDAAKRQEAEPSIRIYLGGG